MLKEWLRKNSRASDKSSIAYRCRKKRMQEFEKFYEGIAGVGGGFWISAGLSSSGKQWDSAILIR